MHLDLDDLDTICCRSKYKSGSCEFKCFFIKGTVGPWAEVRALFRFICRFLDIIYTTDDRSRLLIN